VKVAASMIVIVLFGSIALWQMPMQMTPEVRIPTISVSVRWPGASPHEIEHEIIQELERQLKDVKGMVRMSSWSYYSGGNVTMEFAVGNNISDRLGSKPPPGLSYSRPIFTSSRDFDQETAIRDGLPPAMS
jgi:HAE1 family hydrophobic/amphiphilic exporter-1